jgi:hypothetical protein
LPLVEVPVVHLYVILVEGINDRFASTTPAQEAKTSIYYTIKMQVMLIKKIK